MDKKEDVRETAFKLGTIYRKSPCAYFYLKAINEQILKIAQSYPTIFRTSSKDIPFRIF